MNMALLNRSGMAHEHPQLLGRASRAANGRFVHYALLGAVLGA